MCNVSKKDLDKDNKAGFDTEVYRRIIMIGVENPSQK